MTHLCKNSALFENFCSLLQVKRVRFDILKIANALNNESRSGKIAAIPQNNGDKRSDIQQQKIQELKRFENQVAVITGGADGLGKGIASRLASEGCKVVLFDINEKLLQQTVEDLKKLGSDVEGLTVDIASEDDVKRSIDHVANKFGKIDVMVNSAGIVGPTSIKITEYNTEDFDNIYRINLRGAFLMTKYTVKAMEKNNYGRILLIASIAGKEGNPFMAGYTTMKAGVIGLVKGIGKEYAETGITINGLAPAVIKTAMNEKTAPEQLAFLTAKIPMKRLGTIEEVAAISAWIVSKESTFTTGFIFDISGGRATY